MTAKNKYLEIADVLQDLTTAEREELVRLRRQLRQVQTERDILAKATAWFAGRSDATSTKSSDS